MLPILALLSIRPAELNSTELSRAKPIQADRLARRSRGRARLLLVGVHGELASLILFPSSMVRGPAWFLLVGLRARARARSHPILSDQSGPAPRATIRLPVASALPINQRQRQP